MREPMTMEQIKELIEKYGELRKKTRQYENEITRLLGAPPSVSGLRAGCFVMVSNKVTLAMELLSYYHLEWSRQTRSHPYDDSMWSLLWEITPEELEDRSS